MLRKGWLVFFLIAALFVTAAAAGCAKPAAEEEEGAAEEQPAETEGEAAEAEEAAAEETYLRATFSWPTQIDPAVGSDYSSSTALTNLYDTLVYPMPDGRMDPHLAESWEVSDDSLSYTFKLKRGVKFHDGTEMTAEDVKFSFDRLQAIGEGYAYIFKDKVESVEVLDDYTVRFNMTEPFGPFLSALARLYIVNKEQIMAHLEEGNYGEFKDYGREWLNVNDAGTGAYQVVEFDVGTRLLMKKFDGYFAEIDPKAPDYFEMIGSTEAAMVKTQMMNRELEISDQWQTLEAFNSLDKIEGVDIASWPDGGQLYLMLNTKNPPLDDIHVRKALSWAFNYKAVVENVYPGCDQARGPVSSVIPGWNPDVFQYHQDFDKAKEELAKSKYAGKLDQYPIEYCWTAEVADLEKIALMVQADAQKVGLTVDVVKTPWMKMIDRAARVETTPHIMSIWVTPHYAEAGSILETRYHSANTGSWEQIEWLQNAEIDSLIEESLATVDREERMEKYKVIQEKIVDLAPTIFTYDQLERHAYQTEYVTWPQIDEPVPVMGYNFDARFIQVDWAKRQALLK